MEPELKFEMSHVSQKPSGFLFLFDLLAKTDKLKLIKLKL